MKLGPVGALLLLLYIRQGGADVVFTAEPCDQTAFGLRSIQGDATRYKQCGPSGKVWIVPCAPHLNFDPVEKVCKEVEDSNHLQKRLEKGRSRRPIITTPTPPTAEEFVFSTHRPKRPRTKGKGKKKTTTTFATTVPTTTHHLITEIFPSEPVFPNQAAVPAFPPPGAIGATTIRPEYTVKYNGENMTEEELLRRLVDLVKAQKATAAKEKAEKEEKERLELEMRRIEEEKRIQKEREEVAERIRQEENRKAAERLEQQRKEEERRILEENRKKKEEERRKAVERAKAARKKMEEEKRKQMEEEQRRQMEEERRRQMEEEERRLKIEEEQRRQKEIEEEQRKRKMEEEEQKRMETARKKQEEELRLALQKVEMERIEEQKRITAARAERERLEQIKRIEEAKREQERLEKLRQEEKERAEREKEELMRRERERAERMRQEMERQLEIERMETERQLMFSRMGTTAAPDFEIIRFPPPPKQQPGAVIPPLPTPSTTEKPWITGEISWKPPVNVFSSMENSEKARTTAAPKLFEGCFPNGDCPFSYDGDHFCPHPDNPALYLQCAPMIGRRGRWTIRHCPDGLLFSNHLGRCEKDPYSAYNPNQRVVIPRLPEETRQVSWQGNREIVTVTPVYGQPSGIHNTIDSFPKDLLPVVAPIHPEDLFRPKHAVSDFDDYDDLDLSKIHPLFPRVQPSFINNFLPFQPLQEGEKGKTEDNIIGAVFKPFLKKVALKQTKNFLDRVLSDEDIKRLEEEVDRLRGEGTSHN